MGKNGGRRQLCRMTMEKKEEGWTLERRGFGVGIVIVVVVIVVVVGVVVGVVGRR